MRDQEVLDKVTENPSMTVPYFLMFSYLYYHKSLTAVSDETYDIVCKVLAANWDTVKHPNKDLIDREALGAGTGYYISEYPTRVMSAAMMFYEGV